MGSNKPKGLTYIQDLAHLGNLVCISTTYNGSNSHYSFLCSNGHKFDRSYTNIITNKSCPECKKSQFVAYNKKDLTYWQDFAKSKNLIFLDNEYKNARTPHSWKCIECDCEFSNAPCNVQAGSGCPKCANTFSYFFFVI